jgi:hypothetical protein
MRPSKMRAVISEQPGDRAARKVTLVTANTSEFTRVPGLKTKDWAMCEEGDRGEIRYHLTSPQIHRCAI